MGSHFGVGEFTSHFRTYFSGDWDVHWNYGSLTHGFLMFSWFSGWLSLFSPTTVSSHPVPECVCDCLWLQMLNGKNQ